MQDSSRLKRILAVPAAYAAFQRTVGAGYMTRWLVNDVYKLRKGDKLIDVGCGPGRLLSQLPAGVHYVGFDPNRSYVEAAQKRYGSVATFLLGTASDFMTDGRFYEADLVGCVGVLHHLDDSEVLVVLKLAQRVLKPGGRMVCLEPCFLRHQDHLSRWIMNRDRGRNIRDERGWKQISQHAFDDVSTSVVSGLLWVPWVQIVIECRKNC